ncbi:restriction endonuclease [Emticicia soli]|uniref:DEAD/DEAH box helicase family protein n=1 Tax=Emticicia soli TaxID=2027878 RepID=A0ABW5J9E0_9BACT
MKLQFDGGQTYQLNAIQTVIDIFKGQPLAKGNFELSFAMEKSSISYTEKGIGNQLILSREHILQNVLAIQTANEISVSDALEPCIFQAIDETYHQIDLNFTIEMETGTGKTYTYLRTIYELNREYGFKKFVIVVPSVAIREGVLKNLNITHEHFQGLYNNPPVNAKVYDSGKLTELRNFATSNAIQILVINIDSFTKDTNIINKKGELGIKPIEYIQSTNPIVIVDEPQNMETDVRKNAMYNLNPLCALRYSATHRNLYNLVYNLNPVQAYDLGLVKQIQVDGITSQDNYNTPYVELKSILIGKTNLKAKVAIYSQEKSGVQLREFNIEVGDDLGLLSNGRDIYKDGFILNSIKATANEIEFSNGIIVKVGQIKGGIADEIVKFQIERTVKHHFEKEHRYRLLGSGGNGAVKVLSLFFVDKVANYRSYDNEGNSIKGPYAIWFEEIFDKYAKKYRHHYEGNLYVDAPAEEFFSSTKVHETDIPYLHSSRVHNGYFSQDKAKKWVDSKEKNTKADDDTYNLIMKDKERLLSFEEPLRFIFSHSALREGWDNPNIFQICTLRDTKSDISKRQEIGRGLRLSVDNTGNRVKDKNINILTIVANESFHSFSESLQKEIQIETSVSFKNRLTDANADKRKVKPSKELTRENFPLFFDIWEKINHKTYYRIQLNTETLIANTVSDLKDFTKMLPTKTPKIESHTYQLKYSEHGLQGKAADVAYKKSDEIQYSIPDVFAYVQNRVDITRSTIFEILRQSNRYEELAINPQMFLDNFVEILQNNLRKLLVDKVKYEQINNSYYELSLFETKEVEKFLSKLFTVERLEKTLYNYIQIESNVESAFAKDCEIDSNIKFYFKLPNGFKIPTPLGSYNPDWAVVFENDKKVYFVAETKSTIDRQLLRGVEEMKIKCGKEHFAVFKDLGIEYKVVTEASELYA